jgi:chorismate mutase-like protein
MQDDLDRLRDNINTLDEQIVQLVNDRAKAALEIGNIKTKLGAKVYDPDRERAVLEHISGLNKGPLNKGALEDIFASIITACREIQSH